MKKWLEKLEHIIDKIIPFLLLILLGIIIIDLFFHDISDRYHLPIEITDGIIITIFIIDLIFKYHRARTIPNFIKRYWLDILAVFPFFLVFRVFEGAIDLFETFKGTFIEGQKIAHVGLELKELEVGGKLERITKELPLAEETGAKITSASRSERLARFLKPLVRGSRFGKALHFYEKPHKNHETRR